MRIGVVLRATCLLLFVGFGLFALSLGAWGH